MNINLAQNVAVALTPFLIQENRHEQRQARKPAGDYDHLSRGVLVWPRVGAAMSGLREQLAAIISSGARWRDKGEYTLADAIIEALPGMVQPLVWDQIDEVTISAVSPTGAKYTVWAIDGYGYVIIPGQAAGERYIGGSEAAKAAAQAHYVATIMQALGINA